MQKSYVTLNAGAALAAAMSCRTPAPVAESQPDRVIGCFRRLYADGPPGSGAGGLRYTLTTDAGVTTLLDVRLALLDSAGGATRLDGARVSVVLSPTENASAARTRGMPVRAIRREAGASC
jgi:hypothetical protein